MPAILRRVRNAIAKFCVWVTPCLPRHTESRPTPPYQPTVVIPTPQHDPKLGEQEQAIPVFLSSHANTSVSSINPATPPPDQLPSPPSAPLATPANPKVSDDGPAIWKAPAFPQPEPPAFPQPDPLLGPPSSSPSHTASTDPAELSPSSDTKKLEISDWVKKATEITKKAADIAMKVAPVALDAAAELAESIPYASGIINVVRTGLEILETAQQNKEDLKETHNQIDELLRLVEGEGGKRALLLWKAGPEGQLLKVLQDLVEMEKQGWFMSKVSASDNQKTITACVEKIQRTVRDFHFLIGIKTHHAMAEIKYAAAEIKDHQLEEAIKTVLKSLPYSISAEYAKGSNHGGRRSCFDGTRIEILDEIRMWFIGVDGSSLFWLSGMAGTGKSTIADTVFTEVRKGGFYIASFFCSRADADTSDIHRIIPTLARQLATQIHEYATDLAKVIEDLQEKKQTSPANLSLEDQLTQLILEPLKRIAGAGVLKSRIALVADALDECSQGTRPHSDFINLLVSKADDISMAGIKFFITSRPVSEITSQWNRVGDGPPEHEGVTHLVLHDAPGDALRRDIEIFVQLELEAVKRKHSKFDFTREVVASIVNAAVPLFIAASTVCAFISGAGLPGRTFPEDQLPKVLPYLQGADRDVHAATRNLDELYQVVLVNAFMSGDRVNRKTHDDPIRSQKALHVIATIILGVEPLGLSALAVLLGYSAYDIRSKFLIDLYPVIVEPSDDSTPPRILHASFHDHLTTEGRAHPEFYIDPGAYHGMLAIRCLRVIMEVLTENNICGQRPGVEYAYDEAFMSFKQRQRISAPQLAALRYASKYWKVHLIKTTPGAETEKEAIEVLISFVGTYLLRWIELLAVLNLSRLKLWLVENVYIWLKVRNIEGTNQTLQLLQDVQALSDFSGSQHFFPSWDHIRAYPVQVYLSLYPFLFHGSTLWEVYHTQIHSDLQLVEVIISRDLKNVAPDAHDFNNPYFSPDGRQLMVSWLSSSSPGGESQSTATTGTSPLRVQVFDSETGECLRLIEGDDNFSSTSPIEGSMRHFGDISRNEGEEKTKVMIEPPLHTYELEEAWKLRFGNPERPFTIFYWIIDDQGRKVCLIPFRIRKKWLRVHGNHVALVSRYNNKLYLLRLKSLPSTPSTPNVSL